MSEEEINHLVYVARRLALNHNRRLTWNNKPAVFIKPNTLAFEVLQALKGKEVKSAAAKAWCESIRREAVAGRTPRSERPHGGKESDATIES